MLDLLNPSPPPARVLSIGRVLPLLLALLTLFFLEMSAEVHAPTAQPLPTPPAQTRLVMFWIDSLSTSDMAAPGRLTRLKARLPTALHGPVRECMDAVSVPCMTAASTGLDRFSLFAMVRNFGGASGAPTGSVFHALQAAGKRLGFVGDPLVAQAMAGFDWLETLPEVDDPGTVARGMEALDRERLDFLIIHLRDPDELSHRIGPDGPPYEAAMEVVDREVDAAIARLRPTDHVIIFGDHGHLPDGRHFAGLDVPTYVVAFGPRFDRPMERALAMTDHASLWAPLFGLRFGEIPWVDAYYAGAPVPPQEGLPEVASGNAVLPIWAVVVGVVLAVLVSLPYRVRWLLNPEWRALLLVMLGLAAVTFVAGVTFTLWRPYLYYRPKAVNIGIGALSGLLGLALAWPARRLLHFEGDLRPATGYAALFMAGAMALAAPTVYKFGGVITALTGLVVVAVVSTGLALRAGRRAEAAAGAGLALMLWMVWNPAVRNFAVRWFMVFTETLAAVQVPTMWALALLVIACGAGRQWRPWLLCALPGLALAGAGPWLPPHVFIAPCVLLFPLVLLAHRVPRAEPLLALVAPPALAFFFGHSPERLSPVLCGLAAFPLWARARGGAPLLERGVGLVMLLWLMLWVMLGCRVPGLDFNYFFKWLPEGANVEETWAWNTALTASLYIGAAVVGLLLARRASPDALVPAVPVAWHFARLKLGLVLLFIVGFTVRSAGAGPFITADALMEAGVWVVILLFLLPLPHARLPAR